MCGKELIEGARFCAYCGTPVPGRPVQNVSPASAAQSAPPSSAVSDEIIQRQLLGDDKLVSSGDDAWVLKVFWDEESEEYDYMLTCFYQEGGIWHKIEKYDWIGSRKATERDFSAIIPINGQVVFFAHYWEEDSGREDWGRAGNGFISCRREGKEIVIEKTFDDSYKVPELLKSSYVVKGNKIYGFKGQSDRYWFCFDTMSKEMKIETIPAIQLTEQYKKVYTQTSKVDRLGVGCFYYKGYVYTAIRGIQDVICRHKYDDISSLQCVDVKGWNLDPLGNFIIDESDFIYKNKLYYNRQPSLLMLDLDTMTTSVLMKNVRLEIYGNISDVYMLIRVEGSNYGAWEYKAYDLRNDKVYNIGQEKFYYVNDDGDTERIDMKSTAYIGGTVLFSYTKDTQEVFYSAVSLTKFVKEDIRITDFEIKTDSEANRIF